MSASRSATLPHRSASGREARGLLGEDTGRREGERARGRLERAARVAARLEEAGRLDQHARALVVRLGDGDARLEQADERRVVALVVRDAHERRDGGRDHAALLGLGEVEAERERLEAAPRRRVARVLLEGELVASDGVGPAARVIAVDVAELAPQIGDALLRLGAAGLGLVELDQLLPAFGARVQASERLGRLVVGAVLRANGAPRLDRAVHLGARRLEERRGADAIGPRESALALVGALGEALDELLDLAGELERGEQAVASDLVVPREGERLAVRAHCALRCGRGIGGAARDAERDAARLDERGALRLAIGLERGDAIEHVAAIGIAARGGEQAVVLPRGSERLGRVVPVRGERGPREIDRAPRVADLAIEDAGRRGVYTAPRRASPVRLRGRARARRRAAPNAPSPRPIWTSSARSRRRRA